MLIDIYIILLESKLKCSTCVNGYAATCVVIFKMDSSKCIIKTVHPFSNILNSTADVSKCKRILSLYFITILYTNAIIFTVYSSHFITWCSLVHMKQHVDWQGMTLHPSLIKDTYIPWLRAENTPSNNNAYEDVYQYMCYIHFCILLLLL